MGLEGMNILKINQLCFNAAHYLDESFGKCHQLHGHSYYVRNMEVVCSKVVDFAKIEEAVEKFDHVLIVPKEHYQKWEKIVEAFYREEIPCLLKFYVLDGDSTVENIAQALKREIGRIEGVVSVSFELYEGENKGVKV
jgi:6-pyruvoyl-tetrahydropterin synthase